MSGKAFGWENKSRALAAGILQLQNGVALDSTLRPVTDQANTVSPLQLSTGNVNFLNTRPTVTHYGGFAGLFLQRAGGTEASPTPVVAGNTIQLRFNGYDGTGFYTGATIQSVINENYTSTAGGTSLAFITTEPLTKTTRTPLILRGWSGSDGFNSMVNLDILPYSGYTGDLMMIRAVGGSRILTVNSSGYLAIGGDINATGFGQRLRVIGQGDTSIGLYRNQASTSPAKIEFMKSRGTYDVPLAVSVADELGSMTYFGYTGSAYSNAARIYSRALSVGTGIEGEIIATIYGNTGSNFNMTRLTQVGLGVGAALDYVPAARLHVRGDGVLPVQIWESGLTTVATIDASGNIFAYSPGGDNLYLFSTSNTLGAQNSLLFGYNLTGGYTDVAEIRSYYSGNGTTRDGYLSFVTRKAGASIPGFGVYGTTAIVNPINGVITGYTSALTVRGNQNLHIADFSEVFGSIRTFIDSDGEMVVGRHTRTASAMFEIVSTTKGFLPPRMTTGERDAIATPAAGLVIYNTSTNKLNVFTTVWEAVTSV